MHSWSIRVYKEYFNFAAAHFLIFPDGSKERLHGHNYRVEVEVAGNLTQHGLVIDFKLIQPAVRELLDELDEHWIVPGQHPELRVERRADGVTEVRYRETYYAAPAEDVLILPINNTSSENLAGFIGQELLKRLERRFPDLVIRDFSLSVEETPGQCGIYRISRT
jgi:6-pyruvoyltetrahydropterin/6-carboxytetrahydropterin synthase